MKTDESRAVSNYREKRKVVVVDKSKSFKSMTKPIVATKAAFTVGHSPTLSSIPSS